MRFWLGDWDCTWSDGDGDEGSATNTVYLDFEGRYENGVMDLRHHGELDGAPAEFRALWHSIEHDRLDWAWQRSLDGGETWTTLWAMEYVRVL